MPIISIILLTLSVTCLAVWTVRLIRRYRRHKGRAGLEGGAGRRFGAASNRYEPE